MDRPKIKIKSQTIDYIIELLGIIGLVCLIALPLYFCNDLPETMPKHFNIYGKSDSYGSKEIIWLLPSIGLFLYVGMTWLNKIPHLFNYPTKVTNENAEKLYQIGTRMVRILKVVVILTFAYLNFRMIRIGLTKSTELGILFLPALVLTIVIVLVVMIYKMTKKNKFGQGLK